LVDLQKHAANYVNLSRLQLALNGLRQKPGNESIRVAILGLSAGSDSSATAKQVLKLILADPLKDEEHWEREVDKHDLTRPMIIRVGAEEPKELGTISMPKGNLLHEVNASSATMNGHNLELLLMEANLYPWAQDGLEGFVDSVLVPTVDIPTSSTGRYTPITTPVHKAVIVTDGLRGATSVPPMPLPGSEDVIATAVNLPKYPLEDTSQLPFIPVDVGTAEVGLGLIRRNLNEAMEYEHMWFRSNLPQLVDWVKSDILTNTDNATKPPVRHLIASLLQHASASIQREEARQVPSSLNPTTYISAAHLKGRLDDWAESAHTELQDQLDLAFSSRRWRKLSWWKLFWRVDDVHMISTDILQQRFLPGAERSAIYLAGRIQEAYSTSTATPVVIYRGLEPSIGFTEANPRILKIEDSIWPMNIPAARVYLQTETIPALQALAQKLVFQTLSTSGLTTSLGALVYFGTLTTGFYEAGAVAALGIIWSMRRMQKRWEAARKFWEGEVKEEGRKAVRDVVMTVEKVLDQSVITEDESAKDQELEKAKQLVQKATEALGRLK
jgi:hypothetical protein